MLRVLPLAAAFLSCLAMASPAMAETAVPQSRSEVQLSFAPIVKRVTPAVVNVYAQRVERAQRNPIFDDPFFQDFFGGGAVIPRDRVQRSLGSGVMVDAKGLVITNNHVIEGATEVRVALIDKREFEAEVILRDKRADLAVLRLKGVTGKLATLELADSDGVQVGDLVLAIGNPFGVGQTVTSGIVSALARTQTGISDFQSFIQTDAAINPGNSGGALVDMSGRLVGINTAIFSKSGGSIGIGFAIPAAMVNVVIRSAEAGSSVVLRPFVGATLQSVSAEIADSLGLDRARGALVTAVSKDGPAGKAGLKVSDLITAIDGVEVSDPDDFGYRFATKPLGGTTAVTVLRNGKPLTLTIALANAPESTPRDEIEIGGQSPLTGASVANLSPRVAEDLGIAVDATGVVVTKVGEETIAANLGFRPKDIVVSINGEKVEDTNSLKQLVRQPRQIWRVTIDRDGQRISSVFGG